MTEMMEINLKRKQAKMATAHVPNFSGKLTKKKNVSHKREKIIYAENFLD